MVSGKIQPLRQVDAAAALLLVRAVRDVVLER
jgi:hypothetical protein